MRNNGGRRNGRNGGHHGHNGNGERNGLDGISSRQAIFQHRASLPIWPARARLTSIVKESKILIVVGEPGSGKTTQIPQILWRGGLANNGAIVCTQPRRVAAITIAQRVALEVGVRVGQEVGYSVRFDEKCSRDTKIKYVTDGMLLQEALRDPNLERYQVVVIDEAHERSLHTDVLLGLLKQLEKRRGDDFRIVIMSATLDAQKFSKFFEGARAVYIQGRQHPVEINFVMQPEESYLDAALHCTIQVHADEAPGDILIFLTGQDEIESMARLIQDAISRMHTEELPSKLMVVTVYSAMPPDQQMKAFSPAPEGTRKAILATNIAETSLTIPGVKYVIDSGLVKSRGYSAKNGIDSLHVIPISKAQANQRSGRAGREGPGKAFRLYTLQTFNELKNETPPEILRTNLSSAVLKLKAVGVKDLLNFEFMDAPPRPALQRSLELLYSLGALGDNGELTEDVGKKLSRLPLDPMLGRVLLASQNEGCTQEALAVLSMVTAENIFYEPRERQEEAYRKRARFANTYGDHLTLLNIYVQYTQISKKERVAWCREHFINSRSMTKALDIHKQLTGYCTDLSISMDSCESDLTPLRRALTCGLFPYSARRQPDNTYKLMQSGQLISIHPSSVLTTQRPEFIVFTEMVKTNRVYGRGVTSIDGAWLPELVPSFFSIKSVGSQGLHGMNGVRKFNYGDNATNDYVMEVNEGGGG